MSLSLTISQVLVYYDLPQIMVLADAVSTKYIALLVADNNDETIYLATAISPQRLTNFVNGKIDLREIFETPEINQHYTFNYDGENVSAFLFEEQLPVEYLPETGFVYGQLINDDDIIVREAIEKQNAVVHLSLSDSNDRQSIMADNLGDILKYYQLVIENGFKKVLSTAPAEKRNQYLRPENYKLRAFAASPGSFNLHMHADAQTDLFGGSIIEIALKKFDEILSGNHSEEELVNVLRSVKGHTISSLKHLLQKIIAIDVKVKHKWYAPDQTFVHKSIIDKQKAERITKLLNSSNELSEEIKEFIGYFVQLDTEKGTWRLFNNSDEKEYSGSSSDNLSLLGITLDTQIVYKLICNEVLEEGRVSEKEKAKLVLMSVELVTPE